MTIKEPKNIEILVNIKYKEEEDEVIQRFEFNVTNKKYLDYLFDSRFLFKERIEKLIKDNLLENFISRVDRRDSVEIKYAKQEVPVPCIRKIQAYTPPYFGCKYCSKAEEEGNFLFCPEKKKHYSKPGIQRCPVFRVKEEILT